MKKSKKTRGGLHLFQVLVFILLAFYAFTLIYAMGWAVLSSLKTQMEFSTNLVGLPKEWKFDNYLQAFRSVQAGGHNMFEMFFNSIWYSCGGALLGVIASAMVAYVVAKYEFPGRGLVYAVALVTMMIPVVGSFPSQYRMYSQLGILDSPLLLVTKFSGFGFNFVMLYSFFKTLSWTYAEAGFIDGASHLKVFLKVMLPQALPVMGSLFLVATVQLWNEYMEPNLFLQSHPTLSSGLYVFQLEMTRGTNYPLLFAGLIVSVIPVIILFAKFQNTMMESMSMGGLKG
ncbi:L-arabinose transport system permease protein AraQ [Lachnospiraceae bacterium]|jgi:ABC-type glycerol-3-phosphate transport system permease component|nr:carbohydrate ABC transporter permease [Lachnospiraceae bacterium]GFI64771.1 L-arabinose transport system permease protein AraQ [Lachnospiraceae bacterium]